MRKHGLGNILEEFHREAYLWARQYCGFDEDQAKDVLQSVYLKILEGKAEYRENPISRPGCFPIESLTVLKGQSAIDRAGIRDHRLYGSGAYKDVRNGLIIITLKEGANYDVRE